MTLPPRPSFVDAPVRPEGAPVEAPVEQTAEQLEHKAVTQWANDERLEAMETILGDRVDAKDLYTDTDLAEIFLVDNPELAVTSLTMLKSKRAESAE